MIGAPNIRGQKYWVGNVQWAPETSVSEEIVDLLRNYNIDNDDDDDRNNSNNDNDYNHNNEANNDNNEN